MFRKTVLQNRMLYHYPLNLLPLSRLWAINLLLLSLTSLRSFGENSNAAIALGSGQSVKDRKTATKFPYWQLFCPFRGSCHAVCVISRYAICLNLRSVLQLKQSKAVLQYFFRLSWGRSNQVQFVLGLGKGLGFIRIAISSYSLCSIHRTAVSDRICGDFGY